MAIPLKALESTSPIPTTRAEISVLLAIDPFKGAEVSSSIVPRNGDLEVSRTGASLTEETTICAELVLIENAEVSPTITAVA
jgi:hypothetical protein